MTPPTDKPENPWKKRRKGPREFMPPSRALLAEKDGKKATATWAYEGNHWRCIAARGFLKWMMGVVISRQECVAAVQVKLAVDGCHWHWIEPNTARALPPPF